MVLSILFFRIVLYGFKYITYFVSALPPKYIKTHILENNSQYIQYHLTSIQSLRNYSYCGCHQSLIKNILNFEDIK